MAEALAALGIAANIIAVVDAVKELVVLAKHLNGTMEQVPGNITRSKQISGNICSLLDRLEQVCEKQEGTDRAPSWLSNSLMDLDSDLRSLVGDCDRVFPPKSRHGKYVDRFKQWLNRDDIKARLKDIERQISDCQQKFTTTMVVDIRLSAQKNQVSVKRDYRELSGKLDRIEKLVTSMGKKSTPSQYLEIPDSPKSHRTSLGSRHSIKDEDVRRNAMKLSRTISNSSGGRSSASIHSSQSQSSVTHYGNTGDPAAEIQEAMAKSERILEDLRNNSTSKVEIAQNLDQLSIALQDVGFFEESCEMSIQAVRMYENLYSQDEACGTKFAGALYNQANHLISVGDPTKLSLPTAQRSAKLFRDAVQDGRDVYRPDLAMALNLTAACLRTLERFDDALKASDEALTLMRELVNEHAVVFRADYASFLDNRASILLRTSWDPIGPAREALDIYRELSTDCPAKFRPALASSLTTYGHCLIVSKRYADAFSPLTEAVDIRRALSLDRPKLFHEALASSLGLLVEVHTRMGNQRLAMEPIEECVKVHRKMATRNPRRYRSQLGTTLSVYSRLLLDLKQYDMAISAMEEVLGICHSQDTYGVAGLHRQADIYDDMYICQSSLGHHVAALNSAEKAVELRKQLLRRDGNGQAYALAASLQSVFASLHSLERYADAAKICHEALSSYARVEPHHPQLTFHVALTHYHASQCHKYLREYETAETHARKAVMVFEQLHGLSPTEENGSLVGLALGNLADVLLLMRRRDGAKEAASRAEQTYSRLARKNAAQFSVDLSKAQERVKRCSALPAQSSPSRTPSTHTADNAPHRGTAARTAPSNSTARKSQLPSVPQSKSTQSSLTSSPRQPRTTNSTSAPTLQAKAIGFFKGGTDKVARPKK